jgi:hypothetical protein
MTAPGSAAFGAQRKTMETRSSRTAPTHLPRYDRPMTSPHAGEAAPLRGRGENRAGIAPGAAAAWCSSGQANLTIRPDRGLLTRPAGVLTAYEALCGVWIAGDAAPRGYRGRSGLQHSQSRRAGGFGQGGRPGSDRVFGIQWTFGRAGDNGVFAKPRRVYKSRSADRRRSRGPRSGAARPELLV